MILLGVDEAGLGPTLGPLVVAAAAFRAPGGVDPDNYAKDFFAAFAPEVVADARVAKRDRQRLAVADSKRVHAVGGVELLDRTVRAFLADAFGSGNGDANAEAARARLLDALGSGESVAALARCPWHRQADAAFWTLGPPATAPSAQAVADREREKGNKGTVDGWARAGLRARVVTPGMLNAAFAAGLNKHEAAMAETGRWLRWADRAFADEALSATCDLQGGRRRYAPFLAGLFPEAWVRTEAENADGSVYSVESPDRPPRRVAFRPKADATAPAVSLASMLAKWLREGLMAELNAWFARRVPGLRPTAGYPGDAPRFLADVAEALESENIERGELVRER